MLYHNHLKTGHPHRFCLARVILAFRNTGFSVQVSRPRSRQLIDLRPQGHRSSIRSPSYRALKGCWQPLKLCFYFLRAATDGDKRRAREFQAKTIHHSFLVAHLEGASLPLVCLSDRYLTKVRRISAWLTLKGRSRPSRQTRPHQDCTCQRSSAREDWRGSLSWSILGLQHRSCFVAKISRSRWTWRALRLRPFQCLHQRLKKQW